VPSLLPCGVSPVQRFPQESSTSRSNQLSKDKFSLKL
jgi:hypothetical protein